MRLWSVFKGRAYNSKLGFELLLFKSRFWPNQSLNNIDSRLVEIIPKLGGVFLEVGANNGISQSNTILFERKFGWTGLLIEPIPRLFEQCRRARSMSKVGNFAVVAPMNEGNEVELIDLGLMSIVNAGIGGLQKDNRRIENGVKYFGRKGQSVKAIGRTLSSLIDQFEIGNIDLMSIDIEGFEIDALLGLDQSRHLPNYILVETADANSVMQVLEDNYTLKEKISHHDYLFQRK